MFEPEFAGKRSSSRHASSVPARNSALRRRDVRKVQLLYWREHCLECAPPECYYSCPLYVARQDKRCARFEYGIYPNSSLEGLLPYGAEIRFRKWAKLGTSLYGGVVSPRVHNVLSRLDRVAATIVSLLYKAVRPINPLDRSHIKFRNPHRLGYKGYAYVREWILQALPFSAQNRGQCDVFVMECLSFEDEAFSFICEYVESDVRSRRAIEIRHGWNYHEIPIGDFNGTTNPLTGTLNIYPENDREVRVAFTWLDFVDRARAVKTSNAESRVTPADNVKCVAWDLDNTVWKGILIDDGKENVAVREGVVQLIQALDDRGIIQSVVSKNDETETMAMLAEYGLKDYFVYPMINWEPKSVNLRRLASALNINVDSLALIDDSPFERAEVKAVLPQCRVYTERDISNLLRLSEFDGPVTEESRLRRKSYQAEMDRGRSFQESGGDYEGFLRSCRMEMRIFVPRDQAQIARCLELLQRSNQLNLSTTRYTEQAFRQLLGTDHMLCVGFRCKDRFGDYGIVGFASVDERSAHPRLVDLVISCRVAQKMVERTLLEWLAERAKAKGQRTLEAELVKTERNGPLRSVFESLPFAIVEENDRAVRMRLPLDRMNGTNDVVHAVVDV
jgi:FkbH-like protein